MKPKKEESYYVISYREPKDGKIVSLKAQKIQDSSLGLIFIAISNFIFDTKAMVVTPEEDTLAKHFENVKVLHLSIHAIVSIEEVGPKSRGLPLKGNRSNLVLFPSAHPAPTPTKT